MATANVNAQNSVNSNQQQYPNAAIEEHYSIFLIPVYHAVTWGYLKNKKQRNTFCKNLGLCGWTEHPYLREQSRSLGKDKRSFAPENIFSKEALTVFFGRRFQRKPTDNTPLQPNAPDPTIIPCPEELYNRICPDQGELTETLLFSLQPELLSGCWEIAIGENSNKEPITLPFSIKWVDLFLLQDGIGILALKGKIHTLDDPEKKDTVSLTDLSTFNRVLRDFSDDIAFTHAGNTATTESTLSGNSFWQDIVFKNWLAQGKILIPEHAADCATRPLQKQDIFNYSQRYAKVLSFVQFTMDDKDEQLWNRPISDPELVYTPENQEAMKTGKWNSSILGVQNATIAGYPTLRDLLLYELAVVSDQYASVGWQQTGRGWQYNIDYMRKIIGENSIKLWEYWSGLALRDTCTFVSYDKDMPIKFQAESLYYPLYMATFYLRLRLEKLGQDIIEYDMSDVYRGREIKGQLIKFRNHFWFNELTNNFVGKEVFQKMKVGMDIDRFFEQINTEIIDVNEHLKQQWERGNSILIALAVLLLAPLKIMLDQYCLPWFSGLPRWTIFALLLVLVLLGALLLLRKKQLANWWHRHRRSFFNFFKKLKQLIPS